MFRTVLLAALLAAAGAAARAAEETHDCPTCHGAARVTAPCADCRGEGKVRCTKCGQAPRPVGVIPCPNCRGTGSFVDSFAARQICAQCRGTGNARCTECENGWKKCPACQGAKTVDRQCMTCRGAGKLPGPAPAGEGPLDLAARRAQLRLGLARGREQLEAIVKETAEVEALLAKEAPKEGPTVEAPKAPDPPATRDCEVCQGKGQLPQKCGDCYGTGRYPCPKCAGTGVYTCATCRGNGRFVDSFSAVQICAQCRGAGKSRCAECDGGQKKCPKCQGAKTVDKPCAACAGAGKLAVISQVKPAHTGRETKAALELEVRLTDLKAVAARLQEGIAQLQKRLDEVEAKMVKVVPAEPPKEAPKPPDPAAPRGRDDF